MLQKIIFGGRNSSSVKELISAWMDFSVIIILQRPKMKKMSVEAVELQS